MLGPAAPSCPKCGQPAPAVIRSQKNASALGWILILGIGFVWWRACVAWDETDKKLRDRACAGAFGCKDK
jgi:hypothetical protein